MRAQARLTRGGLNLKPFIHHSLDLLLEPRMLWALVSWPRFSFTSHRMVSELRAQAIRPKTVIDVGANVGQFAVAASRIFDVEAVHCFEPAPDCIVRLRRNVARLAGLTVHPIALGDRSAEATLYLNTHRHSSSMLPLADRHREAFPRACVSAALKIPVSTLDDELAGHTLATPVLIKIDVQGTEAAVLRGGAGTLAQTDYVVVETSFTPMYEGESSFRQIQDLMGGHGFEFSRPVGWLTHPRTGEVLQMDALFTRSIQVAR